MPRTAALDRSQVIPFPDASDLHFRLARSFALITDWNAALNGRFPVQEVLTVLTRQTEARNVALARLDKDRAWPVAAASRPFEGRRAQISSGALARYLRDTALETLIPGSMWHLSRMRRRPGFRDTPGFQEWADKPEICEVIVIVLEAGPKHIDYIEMSFDTAPKPSRELPASIISTALADSWSLRAPGLISRSIRNFGRSRSQTRAEPDCGILSSANPCALSRAEQRVCRLLAAGAKARDIAEALRLSVATVRTHLRNIYAKTGTSGQVELISVIGGEPAATA